MRRARAFLLLPLLLSCSMIGGDDATWVERRLAEAPPRRDLLGYCAQAIAQAGYPAPQVDEAQNAVVSDWRLELKPFAGTGRRFRARIELTGYEGNLAVLRSRVETEKNTETGHPMENALADWEKMPDDAQRARVLLQHTVSLLQTSGAGGRQ